jgi:invasion protein IalB
MHSILQGLATAALLALLATGAAQAQDAPAPEATPEATPEGTPEATPETAPETAPAADEPAATGAAAGDPAAPEVLEIVRDTFGDWEVRCSPNGEDCFMYQLAVDDEQNPVAEISMLKLPAGENVVAGVTIVTPLGTLLPPGLALQIDTAEPRQFPFAWCSQVGCFARFGLDDASVTALKRGRGGKLTLLAVGAPDRPVVLAVSLTGFTAAYDSLAVPAAPAAPAAN